MPSGRRSNRKAKPQQLMLSSKRLGPRSPKTPESVSPSRAVKRVRHSKKATVDESPSPPTATLPPTNNDSMIVNVSNNVAEHPLDESLNEPTLCCTHLLVPLSPTGCYGGEDLASLRHKIVDSRFIPTPTRHIPQPFGTVTLDLDLSGAGELLAVGDNGTGQLGLGSSIFQRKNPQLIASLGSSVVQACAGGMHSLALDINGVVFSWGCNDDFALGRSTDDSEESEYTPTRVQLPRRAVQISAGDSHSAALLCDGTVFAWGTFRDTNGAIGLHREKIKERKPIHVDLGEHVVKIASGGDHLALLSVSARVYTLGGAEQGQLGRVGKQMSSSGGRRQGINRLLTPQFIRSQHFKGIKSTCRFCDVWCGNYSTFVKTQHSYHILASGLNNYFQLGHVSDENQYTLVPSGFHEKQNIVKVAPGIHHSIALDSDGKVYAMGRPEYGRLGLGLDSGIIMEPTKITGALDDVNDPVVDIASGTSVSFAVTKSGRVYSWGMGVNLQTGHGDGDVEYPTLVQSKQIDLRDVLSVSAGGQHTLFIARLKKDEIENTNVVVVSENGKPAGSD
ncbi:hypothetical protein ACOME3_003357 [Neoechinorhynchus agilis]